MPPPANPPDNTGNPLAFLPNDDEYYMEDGFMVFTEAYHRRRGYCCKSQCRHCPWNYRKPAPTTTDH